MKKIPKTELSPDNGCIIDTKWTLGPLSYHASAAGKVKVEPSKETIHLPEIVLYDHTGFGEPTHGPTWVFITLAIFGMTASVASSW